MRIVEYPTFRFSRIAAGIINTRAIQLQFFPKKLLNAVFNKRMRTIDKRPQGNSKKVEGFFVMVAMIKDLVQQKVKQYFYYSAKPSLLKELKLNDTCI
jgi:hypothetical protein